MKYTGHSESKLSGDRVSFSLLGEMDRWQKLALVADNILRPRRCPNDNIRMRVDGTLEYRGEVGKDGRYVMVKKESRYRCSRCDYKVQRGIGSAGAATVKSFKTVHENGDAVKEEFIIRAEDGKIITFLRENGKSDTGFFEYEGKVPDSI